MPREPFDLNQYIMSHVLDGHEWHLPFLPPIHLPSFLSLHGVMLILCSAILLLLFTVIYQKTAKVPTGITNCLEVLVLFIRDQIAIPYLGKEDGIKMTPFLCTLAFFILGLNLLGAIPIFATATANINVTGGLAIITLSFMVLGAIKKNGLPGFLKALTPSGVPFVILILIVPLEFMGLFIRSFALMIRLFANMFAGHIVVLALLGLVVVLGYVALPAVALAVCISIFEIGIAFLQAYIFTLLSTIFIGLMYHPQH